MTARPGAPRSAAGEPVLKDAIRVRRLSRWQAEDLREDLADLYVVSAAVNSAGSQDRGRTDFLRRLAGEARHPGFALLIAETTVLAGCAFGFPVDRGGAWWRGFDGALPQRIGQLTAAGQVFALTQVVGRPQDQHRAIAHRLQERLLTDRQATLGVTLVHPADRAARAAFESWGWQDIGAIVRLCDPVSLRALVLPRAGGPPRASNSRPMVPPQSATEPHRQRPSTDC